jgi:hypothetical protein
VTRIRQTCDRVRDMLVAKNRQYGDSATNPLRVFSKASRIEAIKVRIDDKLSRLQRGKDDQEDTVLDLIGYLILLLIARDQPNKATD